MAGNEPKRLTAGYAGVVAGCFAIALVTGWLASRLDNVAHDFLIRNTAQPPWTPQSVVVAIDERDFESGGGWPGLRGTLTRALAQIADAKPKAVAIDQILHDSWGEAVDAPLEAALKATPGLVLPCSIVGESWENPLDRFGSAAKGIGHVHAERNRADAVSRQIPLELTAGRERRWALALEAFRVASQANIVESPDDLDLDGMVVPAARSEGGRLMRIRWLRNIPTVSVRDIAARAGELRGKTIFIGITAATAAHDRMLNPHGEEVLGVEVHAQAYETLAQGRFYREPSNLAVLGFCIALAISAAAVFALRSGWQAYGLGALVIVAAHTIPWAAFRADIVFPFAAPIAVAWLCSAGAASWQFFVVERQLRRSESETRRYQQAIHFVAHEMRSPLTAIQGSSELMSRYNLDDEKRRQITDMINAESKRLARMIQTFLDVERLSDGQMELKKEPFTAAEIVDACIARVRPIAERKRIVISATDPVEGELLGDRELMEYAVYNLLTNAVKYSPEDTHVRISARRDGDQVRVSVEDQGIGMDAREIRQVFKKFYRTKRAEASGEAGTGIGLSIVEQIIAHHGGRMEVTSEPGKGSCFTMVLAHAAAVGRGR